MYMYVSRIVFFMDMHEVSLTMNLKNAIKVQVWLMMVSDKNIKLLIHLISASEIPWSAELYKGVVFVC